MLSQSLSIAPHCLLDFPFISFKKTDNFVKCYKCCETVDTKLNNAETEVIIRCERCATDLLVPEGVFKVYCT